MTKTNMQPFIKRWFALLRETRNLDYKRSVFARDVRAMFSPGELGDKHFAKWIATDLHEPSATAKNLLLRATAAAVLVDAESYRKVGGYASIACVIGLTKREQVEVIKTALAENKTVRSLMNERRVKTPPISAGADAMALAEYINGLNLTLTTDVQAIIDRWVPKARRVAA